MKYKTLILGFVGSALNLSGYFAQAEPANFQNLASNLGAAFYTHLKWEEQFKTPIYINLLPLQNASGLPIQTEKEPWFFLFGRPPMVLNQVVAEATKATQWLLPAHSSGADYNLEFKLESFQPAPYAEYLDLSGTDNLIPRFDTNQIQLSVMLTAGNKPIKPWRESVVMGFKSCELNSYPQPVSNENNRNGDLKRFLANIEGQNFLAAVNYLLVKTAERLSQVPQLAMIEKKIGHEFYLTAPNGIFTLGDELEVFNNQQGKKSALSQGKLKIVSVNQGHALAYPLTLKSGTIKEGDWVEMQAAAFVPPHALIDPSQCLENADPPNA